jgi:hypothetical protein
MVNLKTIKADIEKMAPGAAVKEIYATYSASLNDPLKNSESMTSIDITVDGGNDLLVAHAIMVSVPDGVKTYGDVTVVNSKSGYQVSFRRPRGL